MVIFLLLPLERERATTIAIAIVGRAITLHREWAIKKEAKNWYKKGCKED